MFKGDIMNKNTHKILKCIKENGVISRSKLMGINRIRKENLDEIIKYLKMVGAIKSFREIETKRNPICYRIVNGVAIHNVIEIRCAYCGVVLTDCNISEIIDKKGYPFCVVCVNKSNNVFGTCAQSSVCFGTYFAEIALSKAFKDVERAPYGNPSYDFICNRGKKIDVKAACVSAKKQWGFAINKNTEADFFLLAAFDNRVDLNLVHLWLIPGCILNDLQRAGIGGNTTKWNKYELPIDKAIKCCNTAQRDLDTYVWNDETRPSRAKVGGQKECDIWHIPKIMI